MPDLTDGMKRLNLDTSRAAEAAQLVVDFGSALRTIRLREGCAAPRMVEGRSGRGESPYPVFSELLAKRGATFSPDSLKKWEEGAYIMVST